MAVLMIILAAALAMDAFSASAATALDNPNLKVKEILAMAIFFAGFQGLMPALGYLLGMGVADIIASMDHFVSLLLLGALGMKMLYEGGRRLGSDLRKRRRERQKRKLEAALAELNAELAPETAEAAGAENMAPAKRPSKAELAGINVEKVLEDIRTPRPFNWLSLLVQSILASIDALVVGIVLAVLSVNILLPVGLIMIATLFLSLIGGFFGKRLRPWAGQTAEIFGGLLLISVGLIIFLQRMTELI